ncbi:hypothetical protein M2275_006285 [Rhodococcus opacus]|nr:hypothetical protein [Rhodococcus opacus]
MTGCTTSNQNYVRFDTLAAANTVLVQAQSEIGLAQEWGGGLVASVDGMRFVVPVRTIHARPNPKYFGRKRGITWLNMLNDQSAGLSAQVLRGTPRDSLHTVDVVLSQQGGKVPKRSSPIPVHTPTSCSGCCTCSVASTNERGRWPVLFVVFVDRNVDR